jgi:3'-5' exonuclease
VDDDASPPDEIGEYNQSARRGGLVKDQDRCMPAVRDLAGIDIVLDDTALLFSAVRGTRLSDSQDGRRHDAGGGRVSLAALTEMVLGEALDKSEQTSDWSARDLSEAQIIYALNDAMATWKVFDVLHGEMRTKIDLHGVDIASGYEDFRFSAAMARDMKHVGVGFDDTAHAAWVTRKAEVIAAIEALTYIVALCTLQAARLNLGENQTSLANSVSGNCPASGEPRPPALAAR